MTTFTLAAANGSPLDGFGINGLAFLSQLISFGIVCFVLIKFVLPIITNMLDKRAEVIREGVENAERAKQELANATKRAEELLLEARRQGQENIAAAQKVAEREARRIEDEAQARAALIEQQQIERIQQEAARARAELSRLVVNLSIAAAGKVINKSVDSNDNRRLVQEFVSADQAKER